MATARDDHCLSPVCQLPHLHGDLSDSQARPCHTLCYEPCWLPMPAEMCTWTPQRPPDSASASSGCLASYPLCARLTAGRNGAGVCTQALPLEGSSQLPNECEGTPDKVHRSQEMQKAASASLIILPHCSCGGETEA